MNGDTRRGRREFVRCLALGMAGVLLTTGCAIPASLAAGIESLPDLPDPGVVIPDLAGLTSAGSPTPAASETPPTSRGTSTPAAASLTPAAPTPAPTTTLVVGKTDGDGVYLRSAIKPEKKVKLWPDGTVVIVIGEDKTVDGRLWKNVRDPAGNVGWMPAQYLIVKPAISPTASAAATATPGVATSASAIPAKWNAVESDPFLSGNLSLAAEQLRALGAAEVKARSASPSPSALLKDLPKYYGTIVRLEGYVSLVETAPEGSQLAKLLGYGVVQVAASCQDGTLVDVIQIGAGTGVKIGDLVAVYGLPVGKLETESPLTGTSSRLTVVSKIVEKIAR